VLVVHQHVLGESAEDPFVLESFERSHALDRVPVKTSIQKLQKEFVLAVIEDLGECLCIRLAFAAFGIGDDNRGAVGSVEKQIASARYFEQVRARDIFELHDVGELVLFVFAREEGVAGVELGEDAAEAPHVDSTCVGNPEDYLWGAIEARLDVSVDSLVLETARAVVNNLDAGLVLLFKQNIFWLQVTVHHFVVLLELQRLQNLDCEPPDQSKRNPLEVVGLYKFIEIHRKQLKTENQVLSKDIVIQNPHNIMLVVFILVVQQLQQFEFDRRLVLEPPFVPDYFDCHHLLRLMVETLDRLPERPSA
jgi:hypothetical protein